MTIFRLSEPKRRADYADAVDGVNLSGPPRIALVRRVLQEPPKRIGALAASFNPPTRAHLKMAEIAHTQGGCGEVLMELAKANVDKQTEHAPLHERLMMLDLTAQGRGWMSIGVGSHGRFIDKTAAVRALYPASEIVFIVGYDTFIRVFDEKYYEDRDAELDALFSAASFLCANRQGDGVEAVETVLSRPENRRFRGAVQTMRLPQNYADMSSTSARLHAGNRRAMEELTPAVADYIRRRGLYR